MGKINIAELLKDCPKGTKLYSPIFGDVYLEKIRPHLAVVVTTESNDKEEFLYDGRYGINGECVLFPSKDQRDLSKFQRPFKDGDVVATDSGNWIGITTGGKCHESIPTYCVIDIDIFRAYLGEKGKWHFSRLATEEEKQKLFQAIKDNGYRWNPETKTLEELPPKFREYSDNEPLDIPTMATEFVKEYGLPCPNGYIFKDDNGNEILTSKIILEKLKKEYPKTYEECCKILLYSGNYNMILTTDVDNKIFNALYRLKVCRDAYWKIAGKEMKLGKSWKPDWTKADERKYCIVNTEGNITKWVQKTTNKILAFPTVEMRDAFKENFDPDIEKCKELL